MADKVPVEVGRLFREITLRTEYVWDGEPASDSEIATVSFQLEADRISIRVSAPYHGEEAPPGPGGPMDRLWEYEVVELFLGADDRRYLEIEFGPHGHYLALFFSGVRQRAQADIPLDYRAEILGNRWHGAAECNLAGLPPFVTVNAYAIHGAAANRRFLAAFPGPGVRPDFHQPQLFRAISDFVGNKLTTSGGGAG